MMGSLGALDPLRKFTGIEAPTLIVQSQLDLIPAEWSRFVAASIPEADFALIEGGSHFPMVEDAEQLRTAVVPWLRKNSAKATAHAPTAPDAEPSVIGGRRTTAYGPN